MNIYSFFIPYMFGSLCLYVVSFINELEFRFIFILHFECIYIIFKNEKCNSEADFGAVQHAMVHLT